MDPQAQLSEMLAAGAWIELREGRALGAKIPMGAAAWVAGRGLVFAELGAEHQGHVHLVAARRLALDGEALAAYCGGRRLVARVRAMSREEAARAGVTRWQTRITPDTPSGVAWARFWEQELRRVADYPPG